MDALDDRNAVDRLLELRPAAYGLPDAFSLKISSHRSLLRAPIWRSRFCADELTRA
jgi:hypothetical protein